MSLFVERLLLFRYNREMFGSIGRLFLEKIEEFKYGMGYFFTLTKEVISFPRKKQIGFNALVMQIFFTGVETLSVVAMISLTIGAVIIIQGMTLLSSFGQDDFTYNILILIIMRELGPLLTAFIIAARSGTAITTELGNMVISHEMEAYLSVGIQPITILAVPRVIGVTVALFILNLYFNLFGLIGSYLVASLVSAIPISEYVSMLMQTITFEDLFSSLLKSFVFGVIIGAVSTYYGFSVNNSVTEVPQKTIKSIANCIIYCIVADGIIIVILAQF